MAKLKITVDGKTKDLDLTQPVLEGGRDPKADLPLDIKEASRRHFKIWRHEDGDWRVKDLDSTNGTLLNGNNIKASRLRHKDEIQIGAACTIRFLDPKPLELKSKADKYKEQREAEIKQKRVVAKQAALAKLAAKEATTKQAEEGAFDINSEETLERFERDPEKFDQILTSGSKQITFGNYTLLKRLAAGGMGVVFKAQHRQGFKVALKLLRTAMVDEQNIARFKQEAWAISAFDHANIVKVRDLAQHGGMYYIAMDFVQGDDLLGVGFRRILTYWQIMEVVHKMADVLRLVHARNIWHRDIKPQNILMEAKTGEIKLIDFGIATVEREKDDATETAEGLIMGTPAFLSPEQGARGKMGEIDGRADLYSLGAVMYYLLSGRRPFTGRSALEILKKNMTDAPPHPHTVDELIPAGLVQICLKLMEKQPDDRYQSAVELQGALAQWRKTKDGRHELERHKKIMKLRERKRKLLAKQKSQKQA